MSIAFSLSERLVYKKTKPLQQSDKLAANDPPCLACREGIENICGPNEPKECAKLTAWLIALGGN
jgi:hypothetical protein